MADGSIVFSTALDNSELEKGIKQAEADIEELKRKISEKTAERNALVEQLVEVKGQINQAKKEQRDYNELLDKGVEIAAKYNVAEAELSEYNAKLKEAEANQKRLASEYAKTYQTSGEVFKSSMSGVEARFNAFASKITKRMKKLFVFSFIFGALSAFKSYLIGIIQEDENFSASVQNLVATLRGVAAPLISALIPPLTAIVNVLTVMITTLARLVDMVFHTNLVESIQQARQAAQSSAAAADATDEQAKATDRLGKAQKKAAKWLAAFDELNVMQKEDSEDAADGIGSGLGDAGGVDTGFAGMDIGKIDDTLAEIMIILGAALLAVGAILAFSGINIPLGITLMAIGALMIYSAVVENWDKLPQEVRDAITGALVFTGVVLVVLGAILALSGAAVPIGIGMMVAGAVLLWTAVALNWDSMPQEMQTVVSIIMGILGVALLVIGAILAFSGGGTPLGIGLMLVGAASLAAAVAINWDSMPKEVREVVTTIGTILGAALLVIGAILTFATPGGQALGVGLMLAGAVSLAAVAALNWDAMPQQVRDVVSTIAGIVGAALIVLGIILVVSGVGLPLGLALIVAGAASLVTAIAVNWDAIKDKVIEVWNSLKSWFDSTVRPVFTVEFWAGLFKSIVNGLISMINYGLNAVGSFINSVAGGISDILNFFGVEGWSFSISMPQIPYLAEGAVIPPNRKFMAVLGDQSSGNNLEAPESLIRQIVREESGAGGQTTELLMRILEALQARQTIECDGYTLARVVNEQNNMSSRIYGAV